MNTCSYQAKVRLISVSVYQCISVSVYQCISVSVYQCISVSVYQCISVSVFFLTVSLFMYNVLPVQSISAIAYPVVFSVFNITVSDAPLQAISHGRVYVCMHEAHGRVNMVSYIYIQVAKILRLR